VADEVMRKMLVPLTERDADRLCELLHRCAQALHAIQDAKSDAA
jgi:hypothetical protein